MTRGDVFHWMSKFLFLGKGLGDVVVALSRVSRIVLY